MTKNKKFTNWNEEFDKLKSFSKVDDLDVYKNFSLEDLRNVKRLYYSKSFELKGVIDTNTKIIDDLRYKKNLLDTELKVLSTKIELIEMKED